MEEKRVTADDILSVISPDLELLAQRMADAINTAEYGAIIAQSEELVRDAHADLRKSAYQKALSLLEEKQQAFSPSADISEDRLEK